MSTGVDESLKVLVVMSESPTAHKNKQTMHTYVTCRQPIQQVSSIDKGAPGALGYSATVCNIVRESCT